MEDIVCSDRECRITINCCGTREEGTPRLEVSIDHTNHRGVTYKWVKEWGKYGNKTSILSK
jgi:hypothetical protein